MLSIEFENGYEKVYILNNKLMYENQDGKIFCKIPDKILDNLKNHIMYQVHETRLYHNSGVIEQVVSE